MGALIAASAALGGFLMAVGVMTHRRWRAGLRQVRPLLIYRVLEREGVSLAGCTDPGTLARAGRAVRACVMCQDRATCLAWLNGDKSVPLQQFCPNADVIGRLREHGRQPISPAAG